MRPGGGPNTGGAYLNISHRGAEAIKKKLPSMHHQFMELAGVDITKQPMEVGPTAHYVMGGVLVNAETQESTVPGSMPAARLPPACMVRTDSVAIHSPTSSRSGNVLGEHAARRAEGLAQPKLDPDRGRSGHQGGHRTVGSQ